MRSTLGLLALIASSCVIFAQRAAHLTTDRPGFLFHIDGSPAGNGIGVGEPKVFDNRSLVLMLEQLDASLDRINAVDQVKILAQLGLLQGVEKSDIATSFSVSTLPIPGVDFTEKKDGTNLMADQRVTKSSEFVPKAPTLDPVNFPGVGDAKTGLAAQDILSEQVSLTYQIMNLRMLLERSITDRYLQRDGKDGPRAQAVLGFQISLDPLRQHKGKAAFVEVELSPAPGKKRPALVSLMPQAKTYNVASISQRSTAFSGSAVVKMVSLGFSHRDASQTYFIHQDADTIAFERQRDPTTGKLVFGWQFRPVLNLKSVEGGVRQLFAVIALDDPPDALSPLEVRINTYWASYDKKDAVVTSRPSDAQTLYFPGFSIPTSKQIQAGLGPVVEGVDFLVSADSNALIDVSGDNFYNGTSVSIGNRNLSRNSPELVVKSDQRLQIALRPADLVNAQPYVVGRYGASAQLLDNRTLMNPATLPDRFQVAVRSDFAITPKNELQVTLLTLDTPPRTPDLKGRHVIFAVDTNVFVRQPEAVRDTVGLVTTLGLPPGTIERAPVVTAFIPFLGPSYRRSGQVYSPQSIERVIVLKSDGTNQTWGIVGKGFDRDIQNDSHTCVIADKKYSVGNGLEFVSRTLATFTIEHGNVAYIKSLIVTLGGGVPHVLAPPAAPQPKLKLDADQGISVTVGSAPQVDLRGSNLGEIARITFVGEPLVFATTKPEEAILFLSRKVTEKPGRASLVVEAKDGSIRSVNLTVTP